jgi:hypothetical protein
LQLLLPGNGLTVSCFCTWSEPNKPILCSLFWELIYRKCKQFGFLPLKHITDQSSRNHNELYWQA